MLERSTTHEDEDTCEGWCFIAEPQRDASAGQATEELTEVIGESRWRLAADQAMPGSGVRRLPNKDGIRATADFVRINMTKALAVHLNGEFRRSPDNA